MRRERRRLNKDDGNFKRVLYITGGILSLTVIAFIAIFILRGNQYDQHQIAKFNTSAINNYEQNSTEETSSQMGRTVNEMQNIDSSNGMDESISEEQEVEEDKDNKKYAVNTSKMEDKSVNTVRKEEESKNEANTKKEEEKEKNPVFKTPVEGEIIREYAKDNLVYSTTLDEWITHNGIDIAAEKTTVVKASTDGTVKSIKNDPRYGLTVVIEHANGFSSIYSNLLTAEFIKEGEKVKQGQTIATVGNTATFEIADESHLHFEILKDNVSVDPALYLK